MSSPPYTVAVPPLPMGATSWYRPAIRPSWAGAVRSCPLPEAGQAAPWLITVNRDVSMAGVRSRLLIPCSSLAGSALTGGVRGLRAPRGVPPRPGAAAHRHPDDHVRRPGDAPAPGGHPLQLAIRAGPDGG